MPFADELAAGVAVVHYDARWPEAFETLAVIVRSALGSLALKLDHIGSTSVPGLASKDCIDLQVRVESLDAGEIVGRFEAIGFRVRPEEWNRVETVGDIQWPKLVFAPPIGERLSNVHVRTAVSDTARSNLLFRDYLRANDVARDAWGGFKRKLARVTNDIQEYGQFKAGPTALLMMAAENWATDTRWVMP